MPDIPFWGSAVVKFGTIYDPEEDVIIFVPLNTDGDQLADEALAMDPDYMGRLLELMGARYKGIMDVRRSVRRADRKGILAETVLARYEAQVIAEDVDEGLRIQSR